MIRTIKVAKDVAVKARTSAMITLKSVLVNAPAELRELQPLTKMALIDRCAACVQARSPARRTPPNTRCEPSPAAGEMTAHEAILIELTEQAAPQLVAAFGRSTRR